jgi:hypothetical protein
MNTYAQGDPVWASYAPQTTAPGTNRLLGDISGFYYPYMVFSIDSLRAGQFPLWNPYTFGGIPYFAANQAALLYPVNLVAFWSGPHAYWTVAALLRLLLAGLGTYLLARRLRTGRAGALLAGGVYMFADFNVVWLHFAIHNVAALLPLALWLIHRLVRDERRPATGDGRPTTDDPPPTNPVGNRWSVIGRRWSFVTLAGVIAAQLFGGHPEMSLFFLVICTAFATACAIPVGRSAVSSTGSIPRRSRWLRAAGRGVDVASAGGWLFAILALALGLALSAVQWLPTFALVQQSYTIEERGFAAARETAAADGYAPLGGLRQAGWGNLRHWLLLVAPQLWGSPRGDSIHNWIHAQTNYNEMTPYVGLAALVLALAGVWRGRNRRAAWFFGGMLLVSLLLFYPFPGVHLLGYLPLLDVAHGFRFGMSIALAAAILAGMGLDWLSQAAQAPGQRLASGAGAMCLVALALAALSLAVVGDLWGGERAAWSLGFTPTSAERAQIAVVYTGNNWRLFLPAAAGLLLAAALAGIGASRAGAQRVGDGLVLPALISTIVLGELLAYGYGYNGFTPPEDVYPPTRAITHLRNAEGQFRSINLDESLWANSAMTHHLQVTGGMDDLKPAAQRRFLERGMAGIVAAGDRHIVMDWGERLMDVMSARYILARRPVHLGPNGPELPLEVRDGALLVYRNDRALPRAYAATTVIPVAAGAAEDIVFGAAFNPHRAVVIEPPEAFSPLPADRPVANRPVVPVPVVEYTPNRVVLVPDLAEPAVVVLADVYDPDWRVTIDGREAPLLRANGLFRGVAVPDGQHQVVFEYRPRLVLAGGVISLAALAVCAALVLVRRSANKTGDR